MTNRYTAKYDYTDGNGNKRKATTTFELDPLELLDWTFENPFLANEMQAGMLELRAIEDLPSHTLTQDEIGTVLYVVKLLTQLSAGRPDDSGEYFIKDPNWHSSYRYRGFRMFLLTNPGEMQKFMKALMDNDTMERFVGALNEANEKLDDESGGSGPDTIEKMRARLAEMEAQQGEPKSERAGMGVTTTD